MAEIVMPQLGESVTEGTITKWFKQVGDHVAEDETLFEVSTDKVDSEVPSPAAGYIAEIRVPEGETVDVGTVLVVLGDAPAEAPPPRPRRRPPRRAADAVARLRRKHRCARSRRPSAGRRAPAGRRRRLRRRAACRIRRRRSALRRATGGRAAVAAGAPPDRGQRLDPATIAGTGVGGRITREDVLTAIDARAAPVAPAARRRRAGAAGGASCRRRRPRCAGSPATRVVPLSNIRLRTGEHMVRSLATSPHVDHGHRRRLRDASSGPAGRPRSSSRREEGFSLTYLPFVARAVVDALAEFPHLNATVGERRPHRPPRR